MHCFTVLLSDWGVRTARLHFHKVFWCRTSRKAQTDRLHFLVMVLVQYFIRSCSFDEFYEGKGRLVDVFAWTFFTLVGFSVNAIFLRVMEYTLFRIRKIRASSFGILDVALQIAQYRCVHWSSDNTIPVCRLIFR